jgi:hypothetical protein
LSFKSLSYFHTKSLKKNCRRKLTLKMQQKLTENEDHQRKSDQNRLSEFQNMCGPKYFRFENFFFIGAPIKKTILFCILCVASKNKSYSPRQ